MKKRKHSQRASRPTAFSYALLALQGALMLAVLYVPGRRDGGLQVLLANSMRIAGIYIVIKALWQLRNYSLTALPEPIQNAKLLTKGLYARVRHPVYSGIMLWGLGTLIIRPGLLRAGLYAALIVLFWLKSLREERMLEQTFGSRYTSYKATTPRFIPRKKQ